jgi:CheY-like chemotaxis protein
VRTVLAATIEALGPAMQAKGVGLAEHYADDVPAVMGDAHRLQQVFWNLLSNAVKFTERGGLVTVRASSSAGWAEVQVSDTGIGIRRDVLPFVFDRFRQADASTTRVHGGLGLGLAIVRHIVELHGGTVKAESPGEGRGATFTLRLPMKRRGIHEPAGAAASPLPRAVRRKPLLGRRVMVVEDHLDARELIVRVLEAAGATVAAAGSAAAGLERFMQSRPDVIVGDLGLPDEDGCVLLGRIRGLESRDAAPVPAIALTAYARASDRARALAAGFTRYILKPVDPQELVDALVAVLEPADDGAG